MTTRDAVQESVDTQRNALIELSHRIHAHPELGFEEVHACAWLSETLSNAGFTVETGICDLPTAFIARAGSGPLHIPYAELSHDLDIAAIYRRNAEALGRSFPDPTTEGAGSTDMGNVSQVIPSIHPRIGIDSLPAVNHQPEFAAHCITEAADNAITDGALAMAWTVIDMAQDTTLRNRLITA
jgi:metal-dependent amidase/aminoacylase/carboxypeptidase family protein